jgi:3-isopropylmalate/(R)-2-methylmalate dehydratase small subunit
MVSEVKVVAGRAVPVVGNDIDTDRIIPARFLKCVTFDGLGAHAFADDRIALGGQHPFDLAQYQGASVLLVNGNFGCGSSREHAPQALNKWGIQAVVGESFSEIFFGNCVALGIPCVTVDAGAAKTLQGMVAANPAAQVRVDLAAKSVICEGFVGPIGMPDGVRQMFVSGDWDATGQLVAQASQTRAIAAKLPYTSWSKAS